LLKIVQEERREGEKGREGGREDGGMAIEKGGVEDE
jgi:hypothetical protein